MYKLIIVLQSGERIELGDRFHTIEDADREGYRILQESRYVDYFEVKRWVAVSDCSVRSEASSVARAAGEAYEGK